jgi:Arc/MetJ family transcription regulator
MRAWLQAEHAAQVQRIWNVYNWLLEYTSMRTNIVIDDKLMRDTLRATGLKTKREAVELGLRTLLRLRKQAGIRRLRGQLDWQGDLNAMRSDG